MVERFLRPEPQTLLHHFYRLDRFAFSVHQLFCHEPDNVTVASGGGLRETMLTPPEFPMPRR